MQKFGIDLSRWQKGFDIEKAKKSGVEFVILKIGGGDDGLYKDSCFNDFYTQCKKIGMPVGCYYFGHALTMEQAKKEADHFNSLVSGKQFEYPVFYDVEADMLKLDKQQLTDVCKYVLNYLEKLGYWVGIYASHSSFESEVFDDELKKYSHWVARWDVEKPVLSKGGETQMWQFGGETNKLRDTVINGYIVDQNYCYVDFPAKIKAAHKNGFFEEVVSTKKSNEEIAKEVISGKWGNGSERKKKLEDAGYNYKEVQTIVNNLVNGTASVQESKPSLKVGASIMIKSGAKDLNSNKKFASFVYNKTYKVIRINGDKVVFGINNVITGVVSKNDIVLV